MTDTVADVLIEALPYIRKFSGMTIVIKYGGHAMADEELKRDFARDVTLLKFIDIHPVIVHGGGPQINEVMDKMGLSATFVRGMRKTDQATMDVVEMVLGGKVNKDIVHLINGQGGRAVGLSGKDGRLIEAGKLFIEYREDASKPPEIIDPGLVGKVTKVNPGILRTLSDRGFIPVVAPVGAGKDGTTYNINADWVAASVACALNAGRFFLMTDVDGVLDGGGRLISSLNSLAIYKKIRCGEISGGMIPKLECALEAMDGGVDKIHIINGKRRHALLLELFTDSGIGTQVIPPFPEEEEEEDI
ncbi:MAG: acetylglutamate kinase [Desulfobacterales bacterium]|nr:MAG: acetylglutamate kinase [Desulfobacterales bacterium]